MNFLSNKDPVFMQISLSNKIQEKRKTDNVLYKQNYLAQNASFKGLGYFLFFFFWWRHQQPFSNLIWAAKESSGE